MYYKYNPGAVALFFNKSKLKISVYLSNKIDYARRIDLEGMDLNLIVLDMDGINNIRIINVYRSFAPQHNIAQ